MATTLTMENTYSICPKALTLVALTAARMTENSATQTHCSTSGNQYFMYLPTAVTSIPTASTTAAQ